MEKMDRAALVDAAEALVPLSDPALLRQLKQLPADGHVVVPGVTGQVVARIDTPAGAIVIGKGGNAYQLDDMPGVAAVIALGGGNAYYEGTCSLERPVLVVLNLGGGNLFRATKPRRAGQRHPGRLHAREPGRRQPSTRPRTWPKARRWPASASCIEFGGNNRYQGVRRVQGAGHGRPGPADQPRRPQRLPRAPCGPKAWAARWASDCWKTSAATTTTIAAACIPNSYKPETPGYEGLGQGVGAGIRQVGRRRDRRAAQRRRPQRLRVRLPLPRRRLLVRPGLRPRFRRQQPAPHRPQRPSTATSAPSSSSSGSAAAGAAITPWASASTTRGNSTYEGTIMGTGMAWDCSVGVLCSFGGKDHYTATGGLTQGCGAQAELGHPLPLRRRFGVGGLDQGYASPSISYHHLPECGGNFSFLVDYGGNSSFGCGAAALLYAARRRRRLPHRPPPPR